MIYVICALIFLVLIYLFLVCPALRHHPDWEFPADTLIAHRGLHDDKKGIPENTLKAYEAAAQAGYPIEIDIRLTSDGEMVVAHDDNLARMAGLERKISEMTFRETKEITLFGTQEHIPSFEECLSVVAGRVPLLIEFKCEKDCFTELCEKADKRLREYNGKYFIQSFNPQVLMWYRKNHREVCRGQLASSCLHSKNKTAIQIAGSLLLSNFLTRPDFISYAHWDSGNISRRVCSLLGAVPAGWTFGNQKDIDKRRKQYKVFIFEGFIPKK